MLRSFSALIRVMANFVQNDDLSFICIPHCQLVLLNKNSVYCLFFPSESKRCDFKGAIGMDGPKGEPVDYCAIIHHTIVLKTLIINFLLTFFAGSER